MKKILVNIFLLVIFSTTIIYAETTQIFHFTDLMSELNAGEEVRVIIHYGDCKLISNNEEKTYLPNAIGGMNIDVYEYFPAGIFGNQNAFVVFSVSKLIENPVSEGYVYNYVKVKITDDEKVRIIARYLDPLTFEEIMDESFYTTINFEDNNGAVYLYAD
ncbi:MAG: hypothetical protein RAP03_15770 [Candidatus Electryonea clarkiae]|nr:hypothetical protein [Candidatus Electryonea clarkiae]